MSAQRYVSKVYQITQEKMNQFAITTGGIGKIHMDPEYASKTPFKGTLVHGLYLFGLISWELEMYREGKSMEGVLEVTFLKPVKSEDPIRICFDDLGGSIQVSILRDNEEVVIGTVS